MVQKGSFKVASEDAAKIVPLSVGPEQQVTSHLKLGGLNREGQTPGCLYARRTSGEPKNGTYQAAI
jgi:hypothetical protein